MSDFLNLYNKLTKLPFGQFLFSKGIGFVAPFFSTIKPKVLDLKPGFCSVQIKDRRSVRNHIGTVNAGALCTLAELTGGMALDASVSSDLRWIPKSMTVHYLKKAKGDLLATCSFDLGLVEKGDVILPIIVQNTDSEEVFKADITFYISDRKR